MAGVVIQFYVPTKFQKKPERILPEERGKVIKFGTTKSKVVPISA